MTVADGKALPAPCVPYRRVADARLYGVLLRSHSDLRAPTRMICVVYGERALWRDGEGRDSRENDYPISTDLLAAESGLSPGVAKDHRSTARRAGWLVGDYEMNARAGMPVPFALSVPESAWQEFLACDGSAYGHARCATAKVGKIDVGAVETP